MARTKEPRPFSRKGLHRLECSGLQCDGFAYCTIARLEANLAAHGRLMVCACGEEMRPERIDVVFALGLDDSPELQAELRQRTENSERSQHRSLGRNALELKRSAGTLNDMFAKTIDDMRQEQRQRAHARRRRGLNRIPTINEPIPF